MSEQYKVEIVVNSNGATSNVNSYSAAMKNAGKETDSTTGSIGKLTAAAQAVASALAVRQVIAYADAWTEVNNKLSNSIRLNETLADVTNRVFDIAQNTRSSLSSTADLYSRLERATREYNVSAADVAKLTKTINEGFIVSGATTAEASGAITQLSQGLASGVLRGEEFNSVNESGNRIIVALAASLGVSVGKMRELAGQGKLTTDVIVKGLLRQSDVISNEFSKTVTTFSQQTQTATQNLTKFIGETALVTSTVAAVGSSLVYASENIQTLIDVSTAIAILFTARLVPSAVAYTTAIYASVAAQLRATITTNAYGQVISRTTVLTNAATLATRGYTIALAALGGPAGVVIIAIASMAALLAQSRDTSDKMDNFAKKTVEAQEAIKGLTQAQKEFKLSTIEGELLIASQGMAKLKEDADKAFNSFTAKLATGSESGLVILQQQAEDAQQKVKDLESQIISLAAQSSAIRGSVIQPLADNAPIELGAGTAKAAKTKESPIDLGYSQRYAQNEADITASLEQELINRQSLYEAFNQRIFDARNNQFLQERLIAEQSSAEQSDRAFTDYENTVIDLEQKRILLLENDRLTAESRFAINMEFDEQELLAKEVYEQSLTEIADQGAQSRLRIAEAERSYNLSVATGAFSDLLGLAAGHSRKAFELAKVGAISTAVITGYDAAVKAWDSGMSTGGPWAPVVAAGYTAASLLKTGSLIAGIKGQSYGGGGSQSGGSGGGLPSVSVPSGTPTSTGAPSAPTAAQDARPQRTINISGLAQGEKVSLDRDQLLELLSGDDDVNIAISNGQANAARIGAI